MSEAQWSRKVRHLFRPSCSVEAIVGSVSCYRKEYAVKGGAGPAHRWCAREEALPDVPLVIRDSQGVIKAYPQCVAEHHAQEWRREWGCEDTLHV